MLPSPQQYCMLCGASHLPATENKGWKNQQYTEPYLMAHSIHYTYLKYNQYMFPCNQVDSVKTKYFYLNETSKLEWYHKHIRHISEIHIIHVNEKTSRWQLKMWEQDHVGK